MQLLNSSIHNIGKVLQSYSYEGFIKGTDKATEISFEGSGQFFATGSKSNKALLYKVEIAFSFWLFALFKNIFVLVVTLRLCKALDEIIFLNLLLFLKRISNYLNCI